MTTATPVKSDKGWPALRWSILAIVILAVYLFLCPVADPPFLQGFRGNLVGEILGGLVFFIFANWLDRKVAVLREQTHALSQETHKLSQETRLLSEQSVQILHAQEALQDKTHKLTEQSVKILQAQDAIQTETHKLTGQSVDILKVQDKIQNETHKLTGQSVEILKSQETLQTKTHELTEQSVQILQGQDKAEYERQKYARYIEFFEKERYHNVRFEDLTTETHPLGLDYVVVPVRDEKGKPIMWVNDMSEMYIVQVSEPAHRNVLSEKQLQEYEDAPIHVGEHYFCQHFNGAWQMGQDSGKIHDWYKFYLSGKLGQPEYLVHADEFLKKAGPPENVVWQTDVAVKADGTLMTGEGGCWQVMIYGDSSGEIWVQPSRRAPSKRFVREINPLKKTSKLAIHNFEGYFVGAARQPFLELLASQIEKEGRKVPETKVYDV